MSKKNNPDSPYEYINIHQWIYRNHGKAVKCENENCKYKNPKRYEWALLKGKEYKRDRNNYIQLCVSCHRKYDYTEEQKEKIGAASKKHQKEKSNLRRIEGQSNKAVVQKNSNGDIINVFKSITEAYKMTKISNTTISNTLHNRSKTAGGYLWEYL